MKKTFIESNFVNSAASCGEFFKQVREKLSAVVEKSAMLVFCIMALSMSSCSTVTGALVGPEKYDSWVNFYPEADGKDAVTEKEALDLVQNFYDRKKISVTVLKTTLEDPEWTTVRNEFGIVTGKYKSLDFLARLTKEVTVKKEYMFNMKEYKMPAGTYFWGRVTAGKEYVGGAFGNTRISLNDFEWPQRFKFIHDDVAKKVLAQK